MSLSSAEKRAIAVFDMNVVDQKLRSIGWIHERTGLGARQYCKDNDHARSPRILFYFDAPSHIAFNVIERHCEYIEVIAEVEDISTFEVISFLGGKCPWSNPQPPCSLAFDVQDSAQTLNIGIFGYQVGVVSWEVGAIAQ